MTDDATTLSGGCHCGAVRFRVRLTEGFKTARRCTCSLYRMRGAVAVSAMRDGLRIVRGEDRLARYRFNTGTAEHFICAESGIYTHHRRRSNPDEFGVNMACLDGVSPFDIAEVPVFDGIEHPADTGAPARRAGCLRFIPAGREGAGAA